VKQIGQGKEELLMPVGYLKSGNTFLSLTETATKHLKYYLPDSLNVSPQA